jgi:hypothetical protein
VGPGAAAQCLSASREVWVPPRRSNDKIDPSLRGAIAQLGERIVRNDEVVGSIPTSSTILTR